MCKNLTHFYAFPCKTVNAPNVKFIISLKRIFTIHTSLWCTNVAERLRDDFVLIIRQTKYLSSVGLYPKKSTLCSIVSDRGTCYREMNVGTEAHGHSNRPLLLLHLNFSKEPTCGSKMKLGLEPTFMPGFTSRVLLFKIMLIILALEWSQRLSLYKRDPCGRRRFECFISIIF